MILTVSSERYRLSPGPTRNLQGIRTPEGKYLCVTNYWRNTVTVFSLPDFSQVASVIHVRRRISFVLRGRGNATAVLNYRAVGIAVVFLTARLTDDADYRAIVEEAKAALAAAQASFEENQATKQIQEAKIQNAEAMIPEAEAAVRSARAGTATTQPEVERTAMERKRQEALMASKATTQQQLESAVADAERSSGLLAGRQADLERAQAALASSRVQIEAQKRACLGSPCTPWILSLR